MVDVLQQQGGGPGGDQDASCLCRHLRRLWHSRSPTPASLIAKFEHKPLFRNWKGHREYGLSPSLLLKHSKSTGAKCPTTPGAALQSLTKLQGRQTTKFWTSGGASSGNSPTNGSGEENLPEGEENPRCPNAQAGGPVIGLAVQVAQQLLPQRQKTRSLQIQKHWHLCSVLSFLTLTLSQIIKECSQGHVAHFKSKV